jgi:pimeloyl-ACP methyl ester carboxylesterase
MKRILLLLLLFVFLHRANAQEIPKGKVITETFLAVSIQGNGGGEDTMRRLTIYLPPGYDNSKKRYPVIYFLHGFPIDDSICMADFRFQDLFDQAIAGGRMNPMILVLPNSYTRFMGSVYTNSSLTGKWADYIAKDVVHYIDKKFRTIPDRRCRGLAGNSMGGHGALKIGMLYSDIFSAVYALSPGGLNWGPYFNIGNPGFKTIQLAKNEKELFNRFDSLPWDYFGTNNDFYAFLFTVLARAFVPNEKKPPFYIDLPVHYVGDSMVVNVDILKKWEDNFPFNMIDTHVAELKRLAALKLDWGRNDEIAFIPTTCLELSKKLEAYGINHFAEEYLGNHGNKLGGFDGRLYTEMLPFFNTYLKVKE